MFFGFKIYYPLLALQSIYSLGSVINFCYLRTAIF